MKLSENWSDKENPNSGRPKNVKEQVALDMACFLDNFSNKCFAIRVLAKETGLNEKTIKRLLAQKNRPTYQTLFKLYSVFNETKDYKKLIETCPKMISDILVKHSPCESISEETKNQNFLDLVKKEPLLAELYILASTAPLDKNAIGFRYGQYGLELLGKLEAEELIYKVDKDTYMISNCGPNLDGDSLKFLGEYFVHRFSKPRNSQLVDQNSISFFAEGLTKEGLIEWLKVDSESFYKKLEIANNPKFKGSHPVFTFTATDTIQLERNND